MTSRIRQRQLVTETAKIMRAVERGERFIVTRRGMPVAELTPIGRPTFVPMADVLEAFRGAPHIDFKQFRRDSDRFVDQDPTPKR
jgi:prevent-host-death family protein